ncbi:MAG: ABC transporter permease [Prevotellaceae bacterium]|jgi:putative ABC transport system permease protein|nr:ABC transporter permease [Prevotellaceae bacterium]
MYRQFLKQAWHQLKENRLLTFISVVGTALAIAMIMAMVIVQRVEVEPYAPEVNRDRTLYVKWISAKTDAGGFSNSALGAKTVKELFARMTTPEAVSAYVGMESNALAVGSDNTLMTVKMKPADDKFFKVFEFSFLAGAPYTEADNEAGLPKVVITETTARKLYGTIDVVGQSIRLQYKDYTIVGVVSDVSTLASAAYAEVWMPLSSTGIGSFTYLDGVLGVLQVAILAKSPADFPVIREEFERLLVQYNESLREAEVTVNFMGEPDTQIVYNNRKWANQPPDMKAFYWQFAIVIVLLLLVPAINLSGLTLSRMRKRYPELGVRRAFGATRGELLGQIIMESLLLTLIGGVVGLLLSYGSLFLLDEMLFGMIGDVSLSVTALIDPAVFGIAFLFCLILNLLSAGIPAWRASRLNIVNALNA